jgi:hypothetical protein
MLLPYAGPVVRYWGNSRQSWILARDGLSAYDPIATLRRGIAALPVGPMQRRMPAIGVTAATGLLNASIVVFLLVFLNNTTVAELQLALKIGEKPHKGGSPINGGVVLAT